MKDTLITLVVLIVIAMGFGYFLYDGGKERGENGTSPSPNETGEVPSVSVIAENLNIPWELVFLPNGDMLVTERPGNLLRISEDRTVIPIAGVAHQGEGGLLGLALHPDFEDNGLLYLYLTTTKNGDLINRVDRYRLEDNQLVEKRTIVDEIPGSSVHDGGRIAFGPDGHLYITTGDAGDEDAAQDTTSLSGKILRVTDDGSIPSDNPFGNAVYSYGHRNPQGLAWDNIDRLFATEHGRSGARSGFDEVNLIVKGGNYGWPVIQGDEGRAGMTVPLAHSGADTTWAPSGAIFNQGSLFFAGLRGQSLYEAQFAGNRITEVVGHFETEFGRLRSITIGPDEWLYVLTNNRDGRGDPQEGDDKIIRINPETLRL